MSHDTKVYVVCCQKGGVGKTTTTVNLAAVDAKLYPPILPMTAVEKLREISGGGFDAAVRAVTKQLFAWTVSKGGLLTCSHDTQTALDELVLEAGIKLDRVPPPSSLGEPALELLRELVKMSEPQVLAVSTDPQRSLLEWLSKVEKVNLKEGRPMPLDYAQEHKNPEVLAKLKNMRRYRRIYVDSPGWLPQDDEEDGPPSSAPVEQTILEASLKSADMAIVIIEPEDLAFRPTKKTIDEIITPMGVPFLVVMNNWDPRDGEWDLQDILTRCRRQRWRIAQTTVRRYKVHTTAPAAGLLVTGYKPNRKTSEAIQDYTELNLELASGAN